MMNLVAALRRVLEAFEAERIDYVVVGSLAAAHWGVERTTKDIDLIAIVPVERATSLIDQLVARDDLYVPRSDAVDAITHHRAFNVLHPSGGGKVDVFCVDPTDGFNRSRFDRRRRSTDLGVSMWVDSAEDVVLAKLQWRLRSRSETQWRDCAEIAAIQQLDREYLRRWAPHLGVTDDLEALLRAVDDAVG